MFMEEIFVLVHVNHDVSLVLSFFLSTSLINYCDRLFSTSSMFSTTTTSKDNAILKMERLPTTGPYPTEDPFLFCVYHKDHFPKAANDRMEAPRGGNGMDFNPNSEYRMYHGETIPGFPQHPHRGFETITATIDGLIDHADSKGNAGRYGQGDLQWMTAGSGIVHSEMFPLLKTEESNPCRFFQIWLNLPAKSKMVDPSFAMFWSEQVPHYRTDDGSHVTIYAGRNYWNVGENNSPPPNSWAADPDNDVAIWHVTLAKNARLVLPPAHFGSEIRRSLFYIEGANQAVKLNGTPLAKHVAIQVRADPELVLEHTGLDDDKNEESVELLLLQGRPINEPVAQHGPFVMNTQSEIQKAFWDYRQTQFGGWPWPRDDMVFDRNKGRFALVAGKEITPESAANSTTN